LRPAPGDNQGGAVAARYAAMIAAGEIVADPAQAELARRFDQLNQRLTRAVRPRSGGVIARLFGGRREAVRGLYVYGEVGRGKTMLMDAFYATAAVPKKRRAHYNEFMGEVHDRIHAVRQAGAENGAPVSAVAAAIAAETRLLCLDEFSVNDVADAMILARLFGALFASGLTLVATSNTPPEQLYREGLNRGLFLPFLGELGRACTVVALDGAVDYRLEKLKASEVYVAPLGQAAKASLDATFRRLSGRAHGEPMHLRVKGRDLRVPEAAAGVARFAFADLCEQPLAAGDYVAIARAFHTVLVNDIRVLRDEERNVARRLILLVDTLYDHRVNLIASAAAEPTDLYRAGTGEVAFAFRRTVSRLAEMRSQAYLAAAHRSPVAVAGAAGVSLAPEHQSG
jgi:cell division protein ZapE